MPIKWAYAIPIICSKGLLEAASEHGRPPSVSSWSSQQAFLNLGHAQHPPERRLLAVLALVDFQLLVFLKGLLAIFKITLFSKGLLVFEKK